MTTLSPSANQCLSCRRAESPAVPGARYTGESPYGLPLDSFFLCNDCVKKGFGADTCAACKRPEARDLPGNPFTLRGPAGPGPKPFWLHNACAPLAGPKQGITQAYLDELAKQNR